MKRFPLPILLTLAFLLSLAVALALPTPTQAADDPSTYHGGYHQIYVVKPGDRLASIARQHCTSWQKIYYMNKDVIGYNPNHIYPGMQLKVVNQCSGHGDVCYQVYDRGPLPHAKGQVWGNHYGVTHGDTWYSISNRFGVPIQKLQYANHMHNLYAGTKITIPCLDHNFPPYPPVPPPIPPLPPPPVESYVNIESPAPGSVLPATFQVNGNGANLFEGNVVVRAVREGGFVLDEKATTLQGPDVGIGGSGTWSVQLTVNVPSGTIGSIQALSPESIAFASVPVTFGSGGGGGDVVYPPGQCQIQVQNGTDAFDAPNGNSVATFVSSAWINALERRTVSSMDWYRYEMMIGGTNRSLWSPVNELAGVGAGCT